MTIKSLGASIGSLGGIPASEEGQPNGVATLDSGGKIPLSEMPFDGLNYQGAWNADTNTPTLADGAGAAGDFYRVSVAGTQDLGSGSLSFAIADHVIYEGGIWQKIGGAAGSATVDLAANYPWTGPHSHTQAVTFIAGKNYEVLAANIAADDRLILRAKSALGARFWFDSFTGTTGISLAEIGVERVYFGTELGTNTVVLDTKTYALKLKTNSATHFASIDTSLLTADRAFRFPDAAGTIALTSDLPPGGTYTPTVTPGSNAASATANGNFIYSRVGSTVQVCGELAVTAQAAGPTLIDFSLPVAPPSFSQAHQLSGSGAATTGGETTPLYARANTGTTNGTINWIAPGTQAHTMRFVAMYTTT